MDHHHHGNEKRMADAVWGKGDGKESTSKNPCPNTEMSDAISTQACYPHNPPSLAAAKRYQGKDKATMMQTEAPPFKDIVNYPTFIAPRGRKRKRKRSDKESPAGAAADETKRGCVMCGRHNKAVTIHSQNKNVCTACDVTVWVHSASGLQIKW